MLRKLKEPSAGRADKIIDSVKVNSWTAAHALNKCEKFKEIFQEIELISH